MLETMRAMASYLRLKLHVKLYGCPNCEHFRDSLWTTTEIRGQRCMVPVEPAYCPMCGKRIRYGT
jgi:hypothetical protein